MQAQTAGQVINLSGPLFSIKADGVKRVVAVGSSVEQGDTLITEDKTYARVKFTDGSETTLRPGTQFKVENFAFAQAEPAKDNAVFSLFKGALRTVTGLVGKRGNQDAYRMTTPTATIGIRGTQYVAEYVPEEDTAVSQGKPLPAPLQFAAAEPAWLGGGAPTLNDAMDGPFALLAAETLQLAQAPLAPPKPDGLAPSAPPKPGGLAPGLYVHVIDGAINLSNKGGSQLFAAGQFGYTGSITQPPVIVPVNPGIRFTPPPAFNTSSNQPVKSSGSSKPTTVDCEVR